METRTVEEVKIYTLVLNDIRSTNIEIGTLTPHIAYEKEDLIAYIKGEAESWQEGNWNKFFKKGSDLEWFNGLSNVEKLDAYGHGIGEQWIKKEDLKALISSERVKLVPNTSTENPTQL